MVFGKSCVKVAASCCCYFYQNSPVACTPAIKPSPSLWGCTSMVGGVGLGMVIFTAE